MTTIEAATPTATTTGDIRKARNGAGDVETRALLLRCAVLDVMCNAPTSHDRAKIEREYNRVIKAHALLVKVHAGLSKLVGV